MKTQTPSKASSAGNKQCGAKSRRKRPFSDTEWKRFNQKMDELAAQVTGLPSDLAENLDHYLHGLPKR